MLSIFSSLQNLQSLRKIAVCKNLHLDKKSASSPRERKYKNNYLKSGWEKEGQVTQRHKH